MSEGAYNLDKLMEQTRSLAADYYRSTEQTLPVISELGKYDACRLLNLTQPKENMDGVDALNSEKKKVQIKSVALFNTEENSQEIGELNQAIEWDQIVLVLLNDGYEADEIYFADREQIEKVLDQKRNPTRSKQESISVDRFKGIGELLWSSESRHKK